MYRSHIVGATVDDWLDVDDDEDEEEEDDDVAVCDVDDVADGVGDDRPLGRIIIVAFFSV